MEHRNGNDVVVTGVGPVTSIGLGADALWESLSQGRSNVAPRTVMVDTAEVAELPMASMPPDEQVVGLARHNQFLASQDCAGHRDLAYALLAIELALDDAGLEYERAMNEIGAIQVFEAPGVETTVRRLFEMVQTPPPPGGPPPVYDALAPCFYNMQPFGYVHLVGKAFGFRGFSTSVHNACSSAAFAIDIAAERIRSGQTDVMVVVGGEAFDTGVRLEWFRRLDLYAADEKMRPFDSESSGFFVGEGGAAIVLESASHAERRGRTPYARYLGGGFAQQGWKQVIPDVLSARLSDAIRRAMTVADIGPDELDLVVPHGAATLLSDGYEAECLGQALEGERDHAVATAFKPNVGHMLACSGLIETVCTLLAVKHQAVPGTLHTHPERVRTPVPLITTLTERPVKTAMKMSTGFTGHDAAQIYQAV